MQFVIRCASVLACAGLALALFSASGGTGAGLARQGSDERYVGEGRFSQRLKIDFRISGDGKRKTVEFRARNVQVICDDRTKTRLTFDRYRAPLYKHRFFERMVYLAPSASDSDQAIYSFGGRISRDGTRAKGYVFQLFDPFDPPGETNRAECSTLAKVPWEAKRIRG